MVTATGSLVPLSRIADVEMSPTPALVNRHEAQRRVIVGFNVRGRSLGDVVTDARAAIEAAEVVPRGQRVRYGGQFETLEEAKARMAVVVPIVMVGIVIVLVALFRAFGPALLIFLNVPFAGVGGVLALASRGMPMSISAAVGFIALSGIAVLNGVVLVSHFNELLDQGLSLDQCVRRGSVRRLRPVLMTAAITALGMVPLLFASGPGSEIQRPLAIVVVGGLLSSTLLTLVLLPMLFARFGQERRGAPAAAPSTPAMPVSGNP